MENAIRLRPVIGFRAGRHRLAFAGLFLFTLLLYARPNEAFPEIFGDFPLAKIAAILTLVAYIGSRLAAAERLTMWPIELKMLSVIVLLGLAFIPIAAAPNDSINLLLDLFLKVVIVFVLMINLLDTRERIYTIMKLVVIAGTVLAFFAISNYIAGKFTVLDKHVGVRIGGVVGGIFGNPNDLATGLDLLIPMAVALAMARRGIARACYFACAGVMAAGVVFTFSRGGFLGLLAVAAVLLWKSRRHNGAMAALAFLAIISFFLAVMPMGYAGRISSIFDSQRDSTGSTQARIDLLKRAADIAIRHPVVGVGMGNFHIYSIREQRAHNSYLEIAAELGIAGLAAYLIMIFGPLRGLRRIERDAAGSLGPSQKNEADSRKLRDSLIISVALQASLVGYIVCSFFGSIQYLWFLYYPLAYAVALREICRAELIGRNKDAVADRSAGFGDKPEGILWRARPAVPGDAPDNSNIRWGRVNGS